MIRGLVSITIALALVVSAGCITTAAIAGGKMIMNMDNGGSFLRVSLDGQEATQDTLKKVATGHSDWKVGEPVSTAPTLSFEITKPDKVGRITAVMVSIYQQFEADYSHQAEFTVVSRDVNSPDAQMKPNTSYNLGSPGGEFKVINVRSEEVSGVSLTPGMKYKLLLTVKADKSETASVHFKTR